MQPLTECNSVFLELFRGKIYIGCGRPRRAPKPSQKEGRSRSNEIQRELVIIEIWNYYKLVGSANHKIVYQRGFVYTKNSPLNTNVELPTSSTRLLGVNFISSSPPRSDI